MRTDHHHANPATRIRPLLLGADSADAADTADNPGRFDDTGRLREKSTDAMVEALVKMKTGDRDSCRLFVRAMEYQLRDYRRALMAEETTAAVEPAPQPGPRPTASAELAAVARAARNLAGLMEALPEGLRPGLLQNLEGRDEMRRGYDGGYLDRLRIEALRLADACGFEPADAGVTPQLPARQEPTVSAAARHFVSALGNMFEECFEQAPTAAPDGAFARTLAVLSEGIGIGIPNDQSTLKLALGRE